MAPPGNLVPYRKICGLFLKSARHKGSLYDIEDVANQLSIAADVENNGAIQIDVAALLTSSFAAEPREYENAISYATLFGSSSSSNNDDNDGLILYAARWREAKSVPWTTAIGCFKSMEDAMATKNEDGSRRLVRFDVGLDIDVRDSLVQLLESRTKDLKQKSKKKKSLTASNNNGKKQRTDLPEDKLQAEIDEAWAEVVKAKAAMAAAHAVVLKKKEALAMLNVSDADAAKATALQARLDVEQAYSNQLKDELKSSLSASAEMQAELIKLKHQEVAPQEEMAPRLESDEGEEETIESTNEYDMNEEFVNGSSVVLNVLINGRACKSMTIDSTSIICLEDLVANLQPLVCDNAETRKKRLDLCKHYEITQFGVVQCFVPSRASIHATCHVTTWRNDALVKKNLDKLVKGERCKLGPGPMRILTAFAQHNHGGSDEGTQMVIAGAWAALFDKIGYDITPNDLGIIVPSQSMLAAWDKLFGVDCFMLQCHKINKSGVKYMTVASDHGERKKIVSLVKVVCFAGRDKGKRIVETFCLDFDSCGHTTDEAVDGIITSLERLQRLCPDVKIVGLSGDAGGGGAVQHLYTRLVERGIMTEEVSRYVNCILHGLNKCIERSSIASFGDQGRNKNTVNQLNYCAMKMLKRTKDEGGLALSNEVNAMVLTKLTIDEEWQSEAAKNSILSLDVLLSKVEDDDIESLSMYDSPKNIDLPVWTRWKSSIKSARIIKERWLIIYFHAVAIIQSKKPTAYLRKLAEDVIGLMNTKCKGDPNGEPVFLAQINFLVAFDDAFFHNAFDMAMREDPEFGGSYGARLWPERVYLLKKLLLDLRGDNGIDCRWDKIPAFQDYLESIKGMPELGHIEEGGIEFFRHIPTCFLDECIGVFDRMIENTWLAEKKLVYLIAGNPTLSRLFLEWLVAANGGEDMGSYIFPSIQIELMHHSVDNTPVSIDTRECLQFLLNDADPAAICKDPLIRMNQSLLWKIAAVDEEDEVDLFDESTWNGEDYKPIVDMIHEVIAPHLPQTQTVESYVQTLNMVSRTNVGGERRSCRGTTHSVVMRPFNRKSVEDKRERVLDQKDKAKIKRVKDRERVAAFGTFLAEELLAGIWEAIEATPDDDRKAIVKDLTTSANKTSQKELAQEIEKYEKGIAKKRKPTKAEENTNGMDITAQMGGKIILSILHATTTPNQVEHVHAEIVERGIELPMELNKMKWKDKIRLLRDDEYLVRKGQGLARDIESDGIKDIKPQSEKMKELFEYQQEHFVKKQAKPTRK